MISLFQTFPFWNTLTKLQQEELLDCTVIRQYEAGEYLENNPGLYMVNDGGLVAFTHHESGRRRVVFSANWTECILLTPTFLNDTGTKFLELRARENSEICYIPYVAWRRIQEQFPDVWKFSGELLSRQMGALMFGVYARMEKNISKRLALFLLQFYERGRERNGTTIHISHEELTEQTGVSREAVTRNLGILKENGLIETGRGKIRIIDTEKLAQFAGGLTEEEQEDMKC